MVIVRSAPIWFFPVCLSGQLQQRMAILPRAWSREAANITTMGLGYLPDCIMSQGHCLHWRLCHFYWEECCVGVHLSRTTTLNLINWSLLSFWLDSPSSCPTCSFMSLELFSITGLWPIGLVWSFVLLCFFIIIINQCCVLLSIITGVCVCV